MTAPTTTQLQRAFALALSHGHEWAEAESSL